jgi:hypothetical protein
MTTDPEHPYLRTKSILSFACSLFDFRNLCVWLSPTVYGVSMNMSTAGCMCAGFGRQRARLVDAA